MPKGVLTITSRNYSSWSLRGWLICKASGINFEVKTVGADDPDARAELLHLSPSFLTPKLEYDGIEVWDVLAIAEFLNEIKPKAKLLPDDRATRAHCRAVSGEMHQGFVNLRSALPMNIKGHYPGFKVWQGAQTDIDRVLSIWRGCFAAYGGPFLFGALSGADCMYAPVVTRIRSFSLPVSDVSKAYMDAVLNHPAFLEWEAASKAEPWTNPNSEVD